MPQRPCCAASTTDQSSDGTYTVQSFRDQYMRDGFVLRLARRITNLRRDSKQPLVDHFGARLVVQVIGSAMSPAVAGAGSGPQL